MIKQEIANVPENSIIFNEAQEYPLRSFTFDPIIYFNEQDQVWICGVELAALDYTGTKVTISLYSAIFEDEKKNKSYDHVRRRARCTRWSRDDL